jgi:hypothetical protein
VKYTDFVKRLKKRPFVPFRIQVSDDSVYEIRHPEMVIPTRYAAYIAIPMPGDGDDFEDVDIVSMEHIVKVLRMPKSETNA